MRKRILAAIIRKDIGETASSPMLLGPVFIPQIATCLVLPALVLAAGYLAGDSFVRSLPFLADILPRLYSIPGRFEASHERVLYVIANYTFVPLLMLMPLQAAMVIGVNSFIGEKQAKTLETLLYTPVSNREFITAKLIAVLVPAVLLTIVECLVYSLVCNTISLVFSGRLIIVSVLLPVAVLVFNPAVSALGLSIVILIGVKAKSGAAAQHVAGVFVLPFVSLMIMQGAGLFALTVLQVVIASLLLLLTSAALVLKAAPRFDREEIIKTF